VFAPIAYGEYKIRPYRKYTLRNGTIGLRNWNTEIFADFKPGHLESWYGGVQWWLGSNKLSDYSLPAILSNRVAADTLAKPA
jgi:hypothetical protein